ncbi:MAG: hypothetical protein J1E95_00400 [Muribaculaceae bacterium]|nr:hypothetical protein [Muribaculaceae bacterium]
MNRKLLNGLLVLAVAAGGVGTFTSCKDDDVQSSVLAGQIDLQAQIEALRNVDDEAFQFALLGWLDYLTRTDSGDYNWSYENLVNAAADMYDIYTIIKSGGDYNKLTGDAKTYVDNLYNWMNYLNQQQDWYTQIYENKAAIEALQALLNGIQGDINDIYGDLSGLQGDIKDLQGDLSSVENRLDGIDANIKKVIADISALWAQVNENTGNITKNAKDIIALNGRVDAIKSELDALSGRVDTNEANIAANASRIALLEGYIQWLLANNAEKVTSVGISQTYNPIFGTLNLPIGLNSMLLATYLYNSETENWDGESFPGDAVSHLYDVTAYDSKTINHTYEVVSRLLYGSKAYRPQNYSFTDAPSEDAGNMGRALVTINPTNLDFSRIEKNVQIINGKGEVILDGAKGDLQLNKYNDDIYFGVSRADDASNGVYALGVNATAENYNAMAISLDNKKEFVTAVRDAIKEHTISDFAHLGDVVYKHLENIMSAYALRVAYDETVGSIDKDGKIVTSTQTNYVVSDYKLAAAVVRPFAYSTALDAGIDKQLPTFSPITEYFEKYFNKLADDIKIDLGDLGGYALIQPDQLTVSINAENIELSLAGMPVYNEADEEIGKLGPEAVIVLVFNGETGNYEYSADMSSLITSIEDALNTEVGNYVETITKQVNDMISKINDDLASLDANINEQLQDILKRIHDASKNKLKYADRLVDLYNKLATRVNEVLAKPNHYLQIMMAYNAGDGLHHLSTTKASPTKISGAAKVGGEPGIELFATSYNADILVPSFKKYVAITGAWENNKECLFEEIVEFNKQCAGSLNQVLSGEEQRVAMGVSPLKGHTVELTYISLDYHGTCSMRQYYIYVEK